MAQLGNAENQKLNGEFMTHVPRLHGSRKLYKRLTAKLRRLAGKEQVRQALKEE